MKQFLLFAGALFSLQVSVAQITLTVSDLASPGDVVIENSITNANEIPDTGSMQNYNFQTITGIGSADTINFVNAASTPFATSIPASNLVSKVGDSYTYYQKDVTGFYLSGLVVPTADFPVDLNFEYAPLNFVQKMPILSFPATYGMNQIAQTTTKFEFPFDTVITLGFVQATVSRVRINGTIKDTSKIDGFGQVQLPGGTFNCLRNIQTLKISFKAEVFASIFGLTPNWIEYSEPIRDITVKQVLLWANAKKSPIATFTLDSNGVVLNSSVQKIFLTNNRSIFSAQPEFEFTPYPNPAAEVLLFNSEKNLKSLKIFSLEGKKIFDVNLTSAQKTIQLEKIGNGIYWIEAEASQGIIARKKLIINK